MESGEIGRTRRRITRVDLLREYFKPLADALNQPPKPAPKKSSNLEPIYGCGLKESGHLTPGHIPNDNSPDSEGGGICSSEWQGTLGARESACRYWLFLREHGWTL